MCCDRFQPTAAAFPPEKNSEAYFNRDRTDIEALERKVAHLEKEVEELKKKRKH
jgi:hypothetical protein